MGSWWRRLCCYALYRFVSWVCVRITVLVYEDDDAYRIPYDWVPPLMIEDVYKHAMKPHLYLPHTRIRHLMTFMRYYERKLHIICGIDCTHSIWESIGLVTTV